MRLDTPWIEWVGDVMPGRDVLRILGFWKRRRSGWLSFSDLIRSDQLGSRPTNMSWDLRDHKMRHVWVVGQRIMVSIGPCDLCLSPRVAKAWRQKEINPFVSETTESACIIIIIIYYWYHHENATFVSSHKMCNPK